jgi:hypothetical protein
VGKALGRGIEWRTGAGGVGGGAGVRVELSAAPCFSNVGLLSPGADVLMTPKDSAGSGWGLF